MCFTKTSLCEDKSILCSLKTIDIKRFINFT